LPGQAEAAATTAESLAQPGISAFREIRPGEASFWS